MDAVKFIEERNRMCAYYHDECDGCPAKREDVMCYGDPLDYQTVNIVGIVEKWSKEHPRKTMLQDFLEKFPKAPLDNDGIPGNCPQSLGYCSEAYCGIYPIGKICIKCWNRPLEE